MGDDRIFWGAVLFMFSDCCIGINLFSFSIPFAQVQNKVAGGVKDYTTIRLLI